MIVSQESETPAANRPIETALTDDAEKQKRRVLPAARQRPDWEIKSDLTFFQRARHF